MQQATTPGSPAPAVAPVITVAKRFSMWLMAAAMVLIVGLKSYSGPIEGVAWHWFGWPLMAVSLYLAYRRGAHNSGKTAVLMAYLITLLFFTRIDGDTGDAHVLELVIKLGLGILIVPALLARYWLKAPLDYSWFSGRWSLKMWLWLPAGFVLAYGFLWLYFYKLTPDLHLSWPLPVGTTEGRTEALWRLFWGCNFVGIWDELAFINFVFVLMHRQFKFIEANFIQAIYFTSFLHEMAFVGWGPVVIYMFALIQGLTYKRTGSLFYILVLHLMIDTILFYMIANRWYPGWGWHPG